MLELVRNILVAAVPMIFAITLHEVAHGWAAYKLGDATASRQGRLSLNPLRHIDPVGTVLVPLLMVLLGGFLFGWAKPVPVDWRNLRKPKQDMVYVAVAGPMANLLMALCWALVIKLCLLLGGGLEGFYQILFSMGVIGVLINSILMVLNLLPVPPLDGGRIVTGLLPVRLALPFARIEPFGLIIIVLLLISGLLGQLLCSPVDGVQSGLATVFGFHPDKLLLLGCK